MVRHPLLLAFVALTLGALSGCSRHPDAETNGIVATSDDAPSLRQVPFDRPLPDELNCSFSMRQVENGEMALALKSRRCDPHPAKATRIPSPSVPAPQLPLMPASSGTTTATTSSSLTGFPHEAAPIPSPLPTGGPVLLPTAQPLEGRYEVTVFQDDRAAWTVKLAQGTSANTNRTEFIACPAAANLPTGSDVLAFSAAQSDVDVTVRAMIRHDHACVSRSATDEVLSFVGAPPQLKVGEKALLATSAGVHPRLRAEITRRE